MTHDTTASDSMAIPAGMKPWHGGDSAPDDWDGGPIRRRDGSVGTARRWKYDFSYDDIVLYGVKSEADKYRPCLCECGSRFATGAELTSHQKHSCPKASTLDADRERTAFEREDRYIVFKKAHLTSRQLAKLEELTRQGPRGLPSSSHDYPLPTVQCVVVEDDWPEYETVWRVLQERVEGPHG